MSATDLEELRLLARFALRDPDPLLRVDADGTLVAANPACVDILEAWQCAIGELVPTEWAARFAVIAAAAQPHDTEIALRGGPVRLRVVPTPSGVLVYGQRPAVGGAPVDGGVGSAVLANMSHELRTPLNAIFGYTELLADELRERGITDLLDDVEHVAQAARSLRGMIQDLLDMARIETGRMPIAVDTFAVDDLLDDLVHQVEPAVQAQRNTLQVVVDASPTTLTSDAEKVRRILRNLLDNAAKFTHDGSVVLRVSRTAERMVFEVSDTGTGIAPDQLAVLFEPFRQGDPSARRRHGGVGLGLALARLLCRQLGGTLDARSTIGKGSIFTLTLPVELAPA